MRNYKKYITVWAMALTMAAASVPVSAAPKEGGRTEDIQEDIGQRETFQVRFDGSGRHGERGRASDGSRRTYF